MVFFCSRTTLYPNDHVCKWLNATLDATDSVNSTVFSRSIICSCKSGIRSLWSDQKTTTVIVYLYSSPLLCRVSSHFFFKFLNIAELALEEWKMHGSPKWLKTNNLGLCMQQDALIWKLFTLPWLIVFILMLPLKLYDNRAIQWNFCIFFFSSVQGSWFLSSRSRKLKYIYHSHSDSKQTGSLHQPAPGHSWY